MTIWPLKYCAIRISFNFLWEIRIIWNFESQNQTDSIKTDRFSSIPKHVMSFSHRKWPKFHKFLIDFNKTREKKSKITRKSLLKSLSVFSFGIFLGIHQFGYNFSFMTSRIVMICVLGCLLFTALFTRMSAKHGFILVEIVMFVLVKVWFRHLVEKKWRRLRVAKCWSSEKQA